MEINYIFIILKLNKRVRILIIVLDLQRISIRQYICRYNIIMFNSITRI